MALLTKQPPSSAGCVTAPVEGSRVNVSTELLRNEVAYRFFPSALTATELGPARPRPLAHRSAPPAAMQPAVPEAWVSFPVRGLRLNTAIALLEEEAT